VTNGWTYKEYDGNLTDGIKDEILSQTKIVIHIPILSNLLHFPWAKTMELICKKVFFIMEECDDMYKLNLDTIVVHYKTKDFNDLIKKISYYLDKPEERRKVTDKLFDTIKTRYPLKDELNKILSL
jgi:spore maturation protein CgeB